MKKVMAVVIVAVLMAGFSVWAQDPPKMKNETGIPTIILTLIVLVLSGGFGGLVSGFVFNTEYKIRIPRSGKLVHIGLLGDILVGPAASIHRQRGQVWF